MSLDAVSYVSGCFWTKGQFYFIFAFKDGLEAISRSYRKVGFWRQTSSKSWKISFLLLPTQTYLWCHSGAVCEDSEATPGISRKERHGWLAMSVSSSRQGCRAAGLEIRGQEAVSEGLLSWFQTGVCQLKFPSHRLTTLPWQCFSWPIRSQNSGLAAIGWLLCMLWSLRFSVKYKRLKGRNSSAANKASCVCDM